MTMRITTCDWFLMVMVMVTEISDSKRLVMVRFFQKRGKNQTKPDFQTLVAAEQITGKRLLKVGIDGGCEWWNEKWNDYLHLYGIT